MSTTCLLIIWDETQGKRGACEISTCLSKQTASVLSSSQVKEIAYYYITAYYRNQYVAVSMLHRLSYHNVDMMSHKFCERGPSQMDNDSVHAAIETAERKA